MLTSLCLAGCVMVSDRSLTAIGLKCRNLQALDVANTKVRILNLTGLLWVSANLVRRLSIPDLVLML